MFICIFLLFLPSVFPKIEKSTHIRWRWIWQRWNIWSASFLSNFIFWMFAHLSKNLSMINYVEIRYYYFIPITIIDNLIFIYKCRTIKKIIALKIDHNIIIPCAKFRFYCISIDISNLLFKEQSLIKLCVFKKKLVPFLVSLNLNKIQPLCI